MKKSKFAIRIFEYSRGDLLSYRAYFITDAEDCAIIVLLRLSVFRAQVAVVCCAADLQRNAKSAALPPLSLCSGVKFRFELVDVSCRVLFCLVLSESCLVL